MWQLELARDEAIAASRAVLTTALADGELAEGEQRWLRACAAAFGAEGVDPCELNR